MLPPSSTPLVGEATVVCTLASRVHVTMRGVRVVRIVDGRRNVSSLTLGVSRTALGNLMDVDDTLLAQARRDTDEWFARVANVDEFFRASTAAERAGPGTAGLSLVAKVSLDVSRSSRQTSPPITAKQGDDIDIVLQLMGLRFLKQHVDVLWRFVSSSPAAGGPSAPAPLPGASSPSGIELQWARKDEIEAADSTGRQSTLEEREAMFCDLFERIDAERAITDARLQELDDLADTLEDGHDAGELQVIQTVSERLDVMAAGPSCRPGISCCL